MSNISIEVKPLTAEAFEPYGDVIHTDGGYLEINQGTCKRFHDLASIDIGENDGRPLLNIFSATPRPRPIEVKLLERHPLSSQAFFPLDNKPYLVLVAAATEKIELDSLRAFLAHGRQGVNYKRGVWHHPLLAIDKETDFIVVDRGGDGENCDEFFFPEDINISIDY